MQPRKLDVLFFFPAYGGNGGIASEVPDIRQWFARMVLQGSRDERIGHIDELTISDTPITMVRNRAVLEARRRGADVMVMVDSDMNPTLHEGEPGVNPFFESSFDFLYEHFDKGPCCIGAPYCGPPNGIGGENVYVFEWQNYGDHGPDETPFSLEQIPRMMAARMKGIQEVAALPTGLIMYDMRCFDLIEPSKKTRSQVLEDLILGKINKTQALQQLNDGFFYYEWKTGYAAEKGSTEDVTNTRDISLAGMAKLGYNPVFCNWDSPAGHWKPWCVSGKPRRHDAMRVAETYKRALGVEDYEDEMIVEASQLIKQHGKPDGKQ